MASLIQCPHCGIRPKEEFVIGGDASLSRPASEASDEAWHDYVYIRANPRGRHLEHWHHTGGCRRFLVIERDTATHEVYSVKDAATVNREAGPREVVQ